MPDGTTKIKNDNENILDIDLPCTTWPRFHHILIKNIKVMLKNLFMTRSTNVNTVVEFHSEADEL